MTFYLMYERFSENPIHRARIVICHEDGSWNAQIAEKVIISCPTETLVTKHLDRKFLLERHLASFVLTGKCKQVEVVEETGTIFVS